jgi:hypothetical protein
MFLFNGYGIFNFNKCIQNFGQKTGSEETTRKTDVDGMIIQCLLGKQCGKLWTGFLWLRIGTNGELL